MNYSKKEDVIKDYSKFICFVLKKMNLMYRYEELFDAGMIGFVRGIKKFDDIKGYKWSTFLYECIKNEILRVIEYENRPKRDVEILSLNYPVTDNKHKYSELQDLIPFFVNYEEMLYVDDVIHDVMIFLSKCKKKHEDIFKYIYGIDGYPKLTFDEIAKIYGTTKQSIHAIHIRLMKKIRAYLKERGFYE